MMLFFELMQVAVGTKTALNRVPSEKEWETLYQICKEQTVQGVAYAALTRLPMEQRPQKDLLMRWYAVSEQLKQRNMKMNNACGEMSNDFRKNGKKHVILKGQGVAQLYPDPLLRVSGDIDVWMEGSRNETIEFMRKRTNVGRIIYHHLEVDMRNGVSVEVHFIPSIMYDYFADLNLQRYFKRVAEREFAHTVTFRDSDISVPVSTLAFNRVYLLEHIYRHLFTEGIGLRQLMDYFFVLKRGFTEEERQESVKMIKSLHMHKFAGAVMYVLQKVFGLEEQNCLVEAKVKEGEFLLSEVMRAGNFGRYDDRIDRTPVRSFWQRFIRPLKRDVRFVCSYPSEVLSAPFFKIFHFCWLKYHGWV